MKIVTIFLCIGLIGSPMMSMAADLSKPEGTVILTVSGNIDNTNVNGEAQFDRQMLEQLPQTKITTYTPWTEGLHVYEGVLLNTLLEQVGASSDKLVAKALNDYHTRIDLEALKDYPILLAIKTDGVPMRVRDKGPIWIIYPLSDYAELDTIKHHEDMIWQLGSLEVY
ncbi:MAG: hypothetical protein COB27_017465 [Moritella sp.]|nr:hypothetical protein [Moritella sp.]